MLVMTAIVGESFRKEPSLSSASATMTSPSPSLALLPIDDELAADDHGRVEPAVGEDRRDHGGRRRLAVDAGDGDGELHLQELRQHFGPRDDGDVAPVGLQDLGVVRPDGRGGDDHVGRFHVGFPWPWWMRAPIEESRCVMSDSIRSEPLIS